MVTRKEDSVRFDRYFEEQTRPFKEARASNKWPFSIRLNYFDSFQNKPGDPIPITFRVYVPSDGNLNIDVTVIALEKLNRELTRLNYDSKFDLPEDKFAIGNPRMEIVVHGIADKAAYINLLHSIKGCVEEVSKELFQDRRLIEARAFEENVLSRIDEKIKAVSPDRRR